MGGGTLEKHIDDSPFAFGTHKGAGNAATLYVQGADFKSCGVAVGSLIKNTTDGSSGLITAVTEDTIEAVLAGGVDNDWDYGDDYEVYVTATENSKISSIWTDRSKGWKTTDKSKLDRGWFPEDNDLDRDTKNIFGPGQPERSSS